MLFLRNIEILEKCTLHQIYFLTPLLCTLVKNTTTFWKIEFAAYSLSTINFEGRKFAARMEFFDVELVLILEASYKHMVTCCPFKILFFWATHKHSIFLQCYIQAADVFDEFGDFRCFPRAPQYTRSLLCGCSKWILSSACFLLLFRLVYIHIGEWF